MSSPLRALLDKEAGWSPFRMVIPHPFLPPRFQKLSDNRNMVLLLDMDMTLHVEWEGSRLHEYHPLTPRAARGLIREVSDRMAKYRRDLQVFSKFVGDCAERPFEDLRPLDPPRFKEKKPRGAEMVKEEEPVEVVASINITEAIQPETLADIGGESPMPMMEEFYE